MDSKLKQQREEFLKANKRNINNAPKFDASSTAANVVASSAKKKPKKKTTLTKFQDKLRYMKTLPNFDSEQQISLATSSSLFGMMAKIVDYMKKRHLENQGWPLTLKECFDEMKQTIPKKTEQWLMEKLPENPKLIFDEKGKFCFKPIYKIKTDEQIKALLEKNYREGKGAILLSNLNECFAKADERMSKLGPFCIAIPCIAEKKKDIAYFYNDPDIGITVDDGFLSLWRISSVENLDEKKIEEYLAKYGLTIIKDQAPKRIVHGPNTRKRKHTQRLGKIQNTHMGDILENYEID
uniref:Transcription initiation factor IIE subunit beta n=1 Tax=Panagrolaimus sp. ES5 TaxID=591445 RepID=A0AC34GS47_9BILA